VFTGIIQATGTLLSKEPHGAGVRVVIAAPEDFLRAQQVRVGDSIACNGVCLTAVSVSEGAFSADVSHETVALTCFRAYARGRRLNLEAACTPVTHLGGHIVQGHVDGTGRIAKRTDAQDATDLEIEIPKALLRYVALKGSVAVDGVSLTVNALDGVLMRLTLIPHTQSATAFDCWHSGAEVNLEVDVLSRYLERLMQFKCAKAQNSEQGGVTLEMLRQNGF
jgi:riboflavin synthase